MVCICLRKELQGQKLTSTYLPGRLICEYIHGGPSDIIGIFLLSAIAPPVRVKVPGTLGFIAQRGTGNKENRIHGPRCGQCEQKAAQVVR